MVRFLSQRHYIFSMKFYCNYQIFYELSKIVLKLKQIFDSSLHQWRILRVAGTVLLLTRSLQRHLALSLLLINQASIAFCKQKSLKVIY